jgi:prolyl 4-hydroxylase
MFVKMTDTSLEDALRLIEANDESGVQLLREIASRSDPKALFALAEMTWSGSMVPQDPARGRLLFEYAAGLGHGLSNLLATNLLANGVAGKREWTIALSRLQDEARALPDRRLALDLIGSMQLDSNGDPLAVQKKRVLSDHPYAVMFDSLLTPTECAYLVGAAAELFEPSMIYDDEQELVRDTVRTSDGGSFHWLIEDPLIHALNRRIAAASGTAYENGEALQVLRYVPGQEYRPHFDWVSDAQNQRIWTALVYLNEDYEGGATKFVRTGLEVRGHTGDMLLFSNADEQGDGDPLAQHAGLPVTAGTKYLATRWIREARWIP